MNSKTPGRDGMAATSCPFREIKTCSLIASWIRGRRHSSLVELINIAGTSVEVCESKVHEISPVLMKPCPDTAM